MKQTNRFIHHLSRIFAFIIRLLLRFRYRINIRGTEIVKTHSPVLFLPNHQALIDPIILMSQIYRFSSAVPVISEKYFDIPVAKWYFQRLGAVRVSDLEAGSRNVMVLKSIVRAVFKGFRRRKNILIYPSGQIAGQGYEKIFNKKAAYHIVEKIPSNVQIVGVRINGLWGSMWSKAATGKSPSFFVQLFKGIFYVLANLLFFVPKRTVNIQFEDLTSIAREKVLLGQKSFNEFLEDFYNVNGEEPLLCLQHFFFLPQSKTKVKS